MGRKVHPIGMRLGINQGWQGRWFAEGTSYRQQLHQDFAIRGLLLGLDSKGGSAKNTDVRKLRKELPDAIKDGKACVSKVEVERILEKSAWPSTPPSPVSSNHQDGSSNLAPEEAIREETSYSPAP